MTALARDHRLIVCVDCGTLSHAPIAAARAGGADVIVADHHLPGPELPQAIVVNPNRADDHLDPDGDGYTSLEEYRADSDPNDASDIPFTPLVCVQ